MKRPSQEVEARVALLLRWYPKDWRDRYGDEFGELLAEQMADQPRLLRLTVDVALGATMARLAATGLSGTTVNRSDLPRRSLATFGCALALLLIFAASIWTHLALASRSADPATTATRTAILIMTVALTICLATAAISLIRVVWTATWAAARPSGTQLRAPTLLLLVGIATLVVGAIAFHSGWAVTRGQPWSQQSIGPSGPASFLWASTLSVSAYWAHPSIVSALPPSEIAWMLISPAALVVSIIGGAKTMCRLDLSTRLFGFLGRAAQVATVGLGLFVFGTLLWLIDGGGGPAHLFQAGTVDRVGLLVMTATLMVSVRSTQRAAIPLSPEP